jgi:gliding motility-associated-like protein
MNFKAFSFWIFLMGLVILPQKLRAQIPSTCFEIESILVDACGNPEWDNEMVRFIVGPNDLNTANFNATFPSAFFLGLCQNATTAANVAALNASILSCGFIKEPVGGVLPAGKRVFFVTGVNLNPAANSFANLADTVYMIFQCGGNTAGHFKNYQAGAGPRTFEIDFGVGCNDIVTYMVDSLLDQNGIVGQGDGAGVDFDFAGNDTYFNNGCAAPVILPITTITPGIPSGTCQGDSVFLSGLLINGTAISYRWFGGAGTFSQPDSLSTTYIFGNEPGGSVMLYFEAVLICSNDTIRDSIFFSITPPPVASISPIGPLILCSGNSVSLTASGGPNYTWFDGSSGNSITISAPGNYFVEVDNGCAVDTAFVSVNLQVSPSAIITPSAGLSLCPGASLVLQSQGGITYEWFDGSVDSSITITAPGNYFVVATNQCGSDSAFVSVAQDNLPVAIIAAVGPSFVCAGDSVILSGSGGTSSEWISYGNVSTITVYAPGTYQFVAGNVCGNDTANYTVNPGPQPLALITAAGPTGICPGDVVQLSASGGSTYEWSDGSTQTTLTLTTPGNYWVVASDACGSDTAYFSIGSGPLPVAQITAIGPTSICVGQSVILVASGASIFEWSTGSNAASITVTAAGTFWVAVTNNCGTDTAYYTIPPGPPPVASISVFGPSALCLGDTALLSGSGNGNYLWSDGSTGTTLSAVNPGTYTLIVSDNCGSDTATVQIMQGNVPQVEIIASGTLAFCAGQNVSLTATPGYTYEWSTGSTGLEIAANQSGNYTVVASNSCGKDTATVSVYVENVAAVGAADNYKPLLEEEVTLFDLSQNASYTEWMLWDSTTTTSSSFTTMFDSVGNYVLRLIAISSLGCTDTTYVVIKVTEGYTFYIPEAFTPNGDGINDLFSFYGTAIEEINAIIYNRWGQPIYNWTNLEGGWDGYFKGGPVPNGVYAYEVKLKLKEGTNKVFYGTLSLIR